MTGEERLTPVEALCDLSYRGEQLTESHARALLRSLEAHGYVVVSAPATAEVAS